MPDSTNTECARHDGPAQGHGACCADENRDLRDMLLKIVRSCEWQMRPFGEEDVCPLCRNHRPHGHADGCPMRTAEQKCEAGPLTVCADLFDMQVKYAKACLDLLRLHRLLRRVVQGWEGGDDVAGPMQEAQAYLAACAAPKPTTASGLMMAIQNASGYPWQVVPLADAQPCPHCGGAGYDLVDHEKACPACKGGGYVPPMGAALTEAERMLGKEDQPSPWAVTPVEKARLGRGFSTTTLCPSCGGDGYLIPHEAPCPFCKGRRYVPVSAVQDGVGGEAAKEEAPAFTGFEVHP